MSIQRDDLESDRCMDESMGSYTSRLAYGREDRKGGAGQGWGDGVESTTSKLQHPVSTRFRSGTTNIPVMLPATIN